MGRSESVYGISFGMCNFAVPGTVYYLPTPGSGFFCHMPIRLNFVHILQPVFPLPSREGIIPNYQSSRFCPPPFKIFGSVLYTCP